MFFTAFVLYILQLFKLKKCAENLKSQSYNSNQNFCLSWVSLYNIGLGPT